MRGQLQSVMARVSGVGAAFLCCHRTQGLFASVSPAVEDSEL